MFGLPIAFVGLLLQSAVQPSTPTGARDPAYARDGRLAVAVHGDLWVRSPSGAWAHLTTGEAWDREPAWSADGATLYFSSNRSGSFDIWRLRVAENAPSASPERLTTTPDDDGEPAPLADGRVVFARGRGEGTRLFTLSADGTTQRLTSERLAERWPAASMDGTRLAWIALSENGRRLHVRLNAA